MAEAARDVGLFVTCLVDLFRPGVGFAAAALLERAGCRVSVPPQTCCGQPGYNSGDLATARAVARQAIAAFEGREYVVAPSGSCAGMLRRHYPDLLADEPEWAGRAEALAERAWELTAFLVDVCGMESVDARFDGAAAYHDSCSGLRELGVREQPRKLLRSVRGLELRELEGGDECCGFGGTFCVKYPDVSLRMAENKIAAARATGAGALFGGDMGCLLNIAGKLARDGSPIAVRHIAEVLAGRGGAPIAGETRR